MPSIINATTTAGVSVQGDNSGNLSLQTNNGTTALTVNTSQNVGIGVASPQARLDISGSSVPVLINSTDNANQIRFSSVSTVGGFIGSTGTNLIFANNAGTEAARIDSSSNFYFNSGYGSVGLAYACRAWVNFDGTTNTGGACTVRGSGNITTVADNGAGDYTVNFVNAMPNANYATFVTSDGNLGANQSITAGLYAGGTYSTTAVRILVFLNGSGGFDRSFVCVSIFR